jgi:hypothetical protein
MERKLNDQLDFPEPFVENLFPESAVTKGHDGGWKWE